MTTNHHDTENNILNETSYQLIIKKKDEEIQFLKDCKEKELHALREQKNWALHLLKLQNDNNANKYEQQLQDIEQKYRAVLASRSWKITKPMRVIVLLLKFDPSIKQEIKKRLKNKNTKKAGALDISTENITKFQSVSINDSTNKKSNINVVFIVNDKNFKLEAQRPIHYLRAAMAAGMNALLIKLDEVDKYLSELKSSDILIMWRIPWGEKISEAISVAKKSGTKIVYDIDTLVTDFELDLNNITERTHTQNKYIQLAISYADYLTTPTNALSTYLSVFGKPTIVMKNGFDDATFVDSRLALRKWQCERKDGLIRIGYVGCLQNEPNSFAVAASAVARILNKFADVRLVLYRKENSFCINPNQYPEFKELENKIEWRKHKLLNNLPNELARFDIYIAPLGIGNPICGVKSESVYFENALTGTCVVASPTSSFRNAIKNLETGFLPKTNNEWYEYIKLLVIDKTLRKKIATTAFRSVLWQYGAQRRVEAISNVNALISGGQLAANAFAIEAERQRKRVSLPPFPECDILFKKDALNKSYVTVIIPLFNYEDYIIEALESVKNQTLPNVDLIVIDNISKDRSLDITLEWAEKNFNSFNRIIVARNKVDTGLGLTRNLGFELADTPYALPLDADNRLLPNCLEICLKVICESGAGYVYPILQQFGDANDLMGTCEYDPLLFASGNYIDAMALISKAAWAEVDGYFNQYGLEDFDFWCKIAEKGIVGKLASDVPLAEYRIHQKAMRLDVMKKVNETAEMLNEMEHRHPWVTVMERFYL